IVFLPQGVYEESVVIQRPCVVQGRDTTIVSSRGPVIQVNAPNVTLRNLRVHLAGQPGVCIRTGAENTVLEEVELNGALEGFPEENPQWVLPSLVDVGAFAAGSRANRVALPLFAPAPLKLSHDLRGVELSTSALLPGLNRVVLTIRDIEDARTLYGVISAVRPGGVVRKIRLYGQARANAAPLELPPDYLGGRVAPFIATHGERRNLPSRALRIRLDPCVPKEFEMETFAFLLNQHGLTQRDEDLLFFNHRATNGIRLADSGEIFLNLDSLNPSVQQVTIVFSIYSERKERLFNQLKGYSLRIEGEAPDTFDCVLPLDDLKAVKTLIALDIYRRASTGEWRVFFRREEYPGGLMKLCERYGLDVRS
ncbi:MAG: TerD family protein, partial [Oscillibacter sp.]|nr:TerD family protein [Oscillibacter sp.]